MLNVVHSLITNETAWKVLGLALGISLDLLRQILDQRRTRRDRPAVDAAAAAEVSAPTPLFPSRRVGELHRAVERHRRNTPTTGKSTAMVRVIAVTGPTATASRRTPNRRRPSTRRS
ncbi:hypothetical protein F4556_004994 [Kitasatospora gansuensis]|uniref:Uncharacterized protein n=1 Tax=Kitasatospora gansuensis TaxID=258050 RepID=A0A7W7SFD2_9ACTN|nr:hypothetical protein [Kitasatospora gansuensis]MBB4949459.1 hypothetical protein [Kitasatospora gansuensis]